jgi:N-acetylglucosamine kinase-like BadF-type ATPase
MTDIYLGVDAGGTKTHAAVMNSLGEIIGVGVAGTGNWERVGLTAAVRELFVAIDEALLDANCDRASVKYATFALAGIDWQSDQEMMAEAIAKNGLGCKPAVMNDAFAVLYAGSPMGNGVASIAGTGGKTVASDLKQTKETLGMHLGEGGGAGQIVSLALETLAKMHHGQIAKTPMFDRVIKALGQKDSNSFFQAVARENLGIDESLAPIFFELATAGDDAAIEIVTATAHQHAHDVIGIVSQMNFSGEIPLIRAGGLHTAENDIFDSAFNQIIDSSGFVFKSNVLSVVPVVGALMHAALVNNGGMSAEVRAQLLKDANGRDNDFRLTNLQAG